MTDRITGKDISSGARRYYDPKVHALMEVMDGTGDTKSIWDPENPDEVAVAKTQYDTLTSKGYRAFHVKGKQGEKGEQMDGWDPKVGRMILIPPLAGG